MRSKILVAATVGFVVLAGTPATAQLRANRPPPQQPNLPRLLVANPHSFSSQDSAASVRVGHGMREEITGIADRWYRTVTRAQMNEALQQYAYPVDAVLPPMVARTLANTLTARAMVISTLVRGEAGRFTVEARLSGISDDAGQMVRLTQNPNESFEEFGERLAVTLAPAFKALPDARACENLRVSAPEKAVEAAVKAIRTLPTSGLAHYCEAEIASAKKSRETDPIRKRAWGDTIITHLKLATQGDPLSLKVWNGLAMEYQAKGDSAATVETFKQMLRIAPTNEPLRKEAFRLFLNYGQTGAAEQVADEGLLLDSANADLWDLKSNACLFQDTPEKTRCAIEALEQVFALDNTKADTTFFTKITFAASRPSIQVRQTIDSAGTQLVRDAVVVDSVRFLKWARKGVDKYPDNIVLIGQLAEAYSLAGPVDSAVAVTKQLMAVDSSDVNPVLRVVQKLAAAKRGRDALALAPYIERLGSPEDKQNLGSILVQAGFPLLQVPDYPVVADMGREVIKLSQPGSQLATYGNYLLGVSLFQQMVDLDTEATRNKSFSCPLGQQLKSMLVELEPALTVGRSVMEAFVAPRLQALPQFNKHVDSIIKQYCK